MGRRMHLGLAIIGIVATVQRNPAAHDQIRHRRIGPIGQMVAVGVAMSPADRIAEMQVLRSVIVDQRDNPVQHIDKFILGAVPVPA